MTIPLPKIYQDGSLWHRSQSEILSEFELARLKKDLEDFMNINKGLGTVYLARYYLIVGDLEQVNLLLDDAQNTYLDDPEVVGVMGMLYNYIDKYDRATEFLSQAVSSGLSEFVGSLYWAALFSNNKELQNRLKLEYEDALASLCRENPLNITYDAVGLFYTANYILKSLVVKVGKLYFNTPIKITTEPDEEAFIAKTPDFPTLYGFGDTEGEAVDMLLEDIENLYFELQEDDNFYPDFLAMKERFTQIVESAE